MSAIYVAEFYADDESAAKGNYGPEFLANTWPAVLRFIDAGSPVFLIENESTSGRVFQKMVSDFSACGGSLLEEGLYQLPSIELCGPEQVDTLKYLSFYNGHLNVFFAINLGSPDLASHLKLWPKLETYRFGSESSLGLREWMAFGRRLSSVIGDRTLLGFGHDGEPLYILNRDPEMADKLRSSLQ